MKEQKSGLMKIYWDAERVILIPVLAILDYAIKAFVLGADGFPLWLDMFGSILGTCIGGPAYGILISAVTGIINIAVGGGIEALLFMMASVAIAAFIGGYVRLGFFSKIKGVALGVVICAFVGSCIWTPIYMALFGGDDISNSIMSFVFKVLVDNHLNLPMASAFGYFVADVVDKGLILFAVYGILHILPESFTEKTGFTKALSEVVVVDTAEEAEFQAESDRLKGKAMERLQKKKAEEASGSAEPAEAAAESGEAALSKDKKKG